MVNGKSSRPKCERVMTINIPREVGRFFFTSFNRQGSFECPPLGPSPQNVLIATFLQLEATLASFVAVLKLQLSHRSTNKKAVKFP